MRRYKKFKVGDKVKILPSATRVGVESEEVGKVGVIKDIRVCTARGCVCLWNVGCKMLELYPVKNQQLEFPFMIE